MFLHLEEKNLCKRPFFEVEYFDYMLYFAFRKKELAGRIQPANRQLDPPGISS